ncbi:MAG: hypothetical protein CMA21_03630 [Euryarchaeota archaeon]|nr:hypothetical protein [Euryarchaeota archaeon]
MEAHGDRNWLRGDPVWWGLENKQTPPLIRNSEIYIPSGMGTPSSEHRFGWARQRMRPLAWSILRPLAWSPFFLISSIFPLIFSGNTPDDQFVSGVLFITSWILLIAPVSNARNSQPTSSDNLLILPVDWALLSLGCLLFLAHIYYSPFLGWVAYIVFWIAFFRSIKMISDVFSIPPARIISPLEKSTWDSTALPERWEIHSKSWNRGKISSTPIGEGKLVLYGLTRKNTDFISISFICKFGFVQDCLFEGNPCSYEIMSVLEELRLDFSQEEWPVELIVFDEEE